MYLPLMQANMIQLRDYLSQQALELALLLFAKHLFTISRLAISLLLCGDFEEFNVSNRERLF